MLDFWHQDLERIKCTDSSMGTVHRVNLIGFIKNRQDKIMETHLKETVFSHLIGNCSFQSVYKSDLFTGSVQMRIQLI